MLPQFKKVIARLHVTEDVPARFGDKAILPRMLDHSVHNELPEPALV
jgi:hypothetical protein